MVTAVACARSVRTPIEDGRGYICKQCKRANIRPHSGRSLLDYLWTKADIHVSEDLSPSWAAPRRFLSHLGIIRVRSSTNFARHVPRMLCVLHYLCLLWWMTLRPLHPTVPIYEVLKAHKHHRAHSSLPRVSTEDVYAMCGVQRSSFGGCPRDPAFGSGSRSMPFVRGSAVHFSGQKNNRSQAHWCCTSIQESENKVHTTVGCYPPLALRCWLIPDSAAKGTVESVPHTIDTPSRKKEKVKQANDG